MFIVDGVRYRLWTPKDEEKEFHPIIKEHINEIFGQDAIYFDRGVQLRSLAGLGAKPEGFVIDLKKNEWSIVEVELSKHDAYSHIVDQLTRFINGIDNPQTRNTIVEAIYDEICKNKVLKAVVEEKVRGDVHHWLTRLINTTPKIVVVIEEKTQKIIEACKLLMRNFETYIIEFKTYTREDAQNVHAHLFEPLSMLGLTAKEEKRSVAAEKAWKTRKSQVSITAEQHLDKIKNVKMRETAIQLRNTIKKISDDVEEYTTREYIAFKRVSERSMFSYLYCQKRGFWFMVKVPRNEFDIGGLDAREQYSGWTHIRVDENTNLSLLIEAAKKAYERTKRN